MSYIALGDMTRYFLVETFLDPKFILHQARYLLFEQTSSCSLHATYLCHLKQVHLIVGYFLLNDTIQVECF